MKLEVSLFVVVILVLIVHTGLQHFISWGWRNTIGKPYDDACIPLMFIGTTLEAVIVIGYLHYLLV